MEVGTCRVWLPDPSSHPTAARKPKQPWTLNLSHCSLFLFSPPDVNSWCNPRNNMDKFLACYFWQLLPPRKEGDYTVGYSGRLAGWPQTHSLACVSLMINPGHTEHSGLASEHLGGQCCARHAAYMFRRCYLFIKSI